MIFYSFLLYRFKLIYVYTTNETTNIVNMIITNQ